jgi:hypothetical protein
MPSPFPGMDPYLEAPEIWEDFHASLAREIRDQLAPRLQPRYFAALTPRVTYEEVIIEEKRVAKPDVSGSKITETPLSSSAIAILPAPMVGLAVLEVPVKEQSIEIREARTGTLVTAIEILSPVNKRRGHEAYETYRRKRRDLLRAGVHLLEIDFLRSGERPPLVTPLPEAPYFVFLSRVQRRPNVDIWPLPLRDEIPIVPVPLAEPDPDVALDLGLAHKAPHGSSSAIANGNLDDA